MQFGKGLHDWRDTFKGGVITGEMESQMVLCIGSALLALKLTTTSAGEAL